MHINSLGLRTDLSLLDCEVNDRGSYLAVRSPKEPAFYWGNLLVFPRAPQAGEAREWQRAFAEEFSKWPSIKHQTFAWDTTDGESGEVAPFVALGFEHERNLVLTADSVEPPPHLNLEIVIRDVLSDADWLQVRQCQLESRDAKFSEASYEAYLDDRLSAHRARLARGEGRWFGAFLGDRLLGSLGVFVIDNIARYQVVTTSPTHRRRGVCGTLVYESARATLLKPEVETLVMVADENYHAARIYESVGFARSEVVQGLCLQPTS